MTPPRWSVSILCLGLLCGCDAIARTPPAEDPSPTAVAATATDGGVTLPEASLPFIEIEAVGPEVIGVVEAPGRLAFRDAAVARVGSPLQGRIEAVHVQLGEHVEAGAPLFTIGSPDAAAIRAELASARSRMNAARLEVERQTSLQEGGVGLQSELVRAQAELAQAETEAQRAKVAVGLIGRGSGGRVVVRSPIAGTVLSRRATAGTVAEVGEETLVEIGDPRDLWVVVDVFEDELAMVRPGASAQVLTSASVEPLSAQVLRVGGAVDDQTRRAPVVLALLEVPDQAHAGMFVRARLETTAEGRASLPASAVLIGDGGRTKAYVATSVPNHFEPRDIVVGRAVDGRVPVLSGLAPGERVVVGNALLLDAAADQLL